MEDIAFNDWPGQPVDSGGNAWLPAYGFQPPSALLDRDDFLGNPDADYFLQNTTSTPCLYLETIHEETSDDLRSDSDISDVRGGEDGASPLGWLATDSETDSVICMDATNDSDCESDREIACPIKRRRHHDYTNLLSLPSEEEYQSLSRSSSLLQFETLEKECQEISTSTPSIYSQFSLDSLENQFHHHHRNNPLNCKVVFEQKNKFNGLTSSSESSGSDTCDSETTLAPSLTHLKPWHSFDNLTKHSNGNKNKVSAENLSEDSGYSDHMSNSLTTTPHFQFGKTMMRKASTFGAYDCEVFQQFQGNFGASCQNLSVFDEDNDWIGGRMLIATRNVNLEKLQPPQPASMLISSTTTASSSSSECRSKYNCTSSASEPNLLKSATDNDQQATAHHSVFSSIETNYNNLLSVCSVPKNLDLIGVSAALTSINAKEKQANDINSVAVKNWDLADLATKEEMAAQFRREGSYAEAMTNRVDLSDDEQSLCYKKKPPRTPIVEFDRKILHAISESIHSINSHQSVADNYLANIYNPPLTSSRNVASTPNLAMSPAYLDKLMLEEERRRSVQDVRLPRKSSLINHSTSTSCISDTDETKATTPCDSTASKGVHFSPVVSEVNWRDDDNNSTSTTVERESSSNYSLSSTPEREAIDELTKQLLEFTTNDRCISQPNLRQRQQKEQQEEHVTERRMVDVERFRSNYSQSQPDVSKLKRRGSQLVKKDADGCVIKAYVDGDGIQYKHTHLDSVGGSAETLLSPPLPLSGSKSHVYGGRSCVGEDNNKRIAVAGMESFDVHHQQQQLNNFNQNNNNKGKCAQASGLGGGGGGKIGGFFSRLASFRFSNRNKDEKKSKKKQQQQRDASSAKPSDALPHQRIASREDYIYIPLKGPSSPPTRTAPASTSTPINNVNSHQHPHQHQVREKPPLPKVPPRVVGASVKRTDNNFVAQNPYQQHNQHARGGGGSGGGNSPSSFAAAVTDQQHQRRRRTIDSGESCPRPMEPMGLIETDLDTEVTVITSGPNVKTRSLLNLGAEPRLGGLLLHANANDSDSSAGGHNNHSKYPSARPHKSMEFLLDKQNLKVVEPPENELQKGERVMSEHQLRIQRSLQKLTVPEWYKQSQVPREGFLLKKHSTNREMRWTGTGSKTTSLSSLGSVVSTNNHSPIVLSPTSNQPFIRWSTSKLNSTASSPCASTRSSFNARQPNGSISPSSVRSSFSYRQPYLGWRSQERLNKPRTPAERLANSLLAAQSNHHHHLNTNSHHHHHHHHQQQQQQQESPEIQTSIKEVTSAIVHYVSGLKPESGGDDQHSQRSRSVSPRGSQKLCWLESSFVGMRPLDSPQTPVSLTESQSATSNAAGGGVVVPPPPSTLRLELQTHNDVTLLNTTSIPKPSPGSTTLEDVLDSLLGLPSSERAPSPSLQAMESASSSPSRLVCDDANKFRRRSEGSNNSAVQQHNGDELPRRISIESASSTLMQCRYSRCGRTVASNSPEAGTYKNCHNCSFTYCSRTCRRAHWEKHRKTCLFSRIGSLCRQIIAAFKENKDTLFHVSQIARRGYLSHGAGVVKCFFTCSEAAETFLAQGIASLGELTYIRWPDLLPSEMGPQLYTELVQMCKSYNPDSKMVLYVCICVISETPATGAVKWERQLVSRCAKMRLSKDVCLPDKDHHHHHHYQHDNPETLILTCKAIENDGVNNKELKELSVSNVQKQLRLRGVSLKRQHPVIYRQLCNYASGECEKLTPITVYANDGNTGKSFMCIIMLEADPDSLKQVELAGVRVRTVDVLCE